MKARAIIKDVLRRSGIGPKDLFGPCRMRHLVRARRTAAVELRQTGLSKAAIGRMLKRDQKTITYHLKQAEALA